MFLFGLIIGLLLSGGLLFVLKYYDYIELEMSEKFKSYFGIFYHNKKDTEE